MKEIKALEQAEQSGKTLKELCINHTFYRAYWYSKEAGSDNLNFDDVIWDYDIEEIIANCKEYEIDKFTISSCFSSLIPTLAKFEECGGKMEGLTQVRSRSTDFDTGEKRIIPAIIIRL